MTRVGVLSHPESTASTEGSRRLTPIWLVAFAGHRPKHGEPERSQAAIETCRDPLRAVLLRLKGSAEAVGGRIELLTSLAEGADLLAIQVAEELDIYVHLYLPLPEATFAQDFTGPDGAVAWQRAQHFIRKAEDPSSGWTVRVAANALERPGCYHDTNLALLEAADVLVALCREDLLHDEMDTAIGGTAELVRLADEEHLKTPTIVLDLLTGGEVVRDAELPVAGPSEKLLDKLEAEMGRIEAPSAMSRGGSMPVGEVHRRLDAVAKLSGDIYRKAFRRSILLHFVATVLAAASAAFSKVLVGSPAVPEILTFFELVFVVFATILVERASHSNENPRWRAARFGAELSDGQISTAGITDPLRPPVLRHAERWRRFAVSLGLTAQRQRLSALAGLSPTERLARLRSEYLTARVRTQLDYLGTQQGLAAQRFDRWRRISFIVSIAAILVISVALVVKVSYAKAGKDLFTAALTLFLPILLPVLASLSSAMIVAHDAARRTGRYAQVKERLKRAEALLPLVRTQASLARVVGETEDVLLDEVIEWNATTETLEHLH